MSFPAGFLFDYIPQCDVTEKIPKGALGKNGQNIDSSLFLLAKLMNFETENTFSQNRRWLK